MIVSNGQSPRVFNLLTYAYIMDFPYNILIIRGYYVSSIDRFFFGTYNGQFAYFDVAPIASGSLNPTLIFQSSNTDAGMSDNPFFTVSTS